MASRLSPQAACRYRSPGPPVRGEAPSAVQCVSPQAAHRQIHTAQAWGGPLQRVNSYEPCRHGSPTPSTQTARSSVPALLHSPQQASRHSQGPQGEQNLTARPHWLGGGMNSPQAGITTRVPSNANLHSGLGAPQQPRMPQASQGRGLPQTRMPHDVTSVLSQPKNICGLQEDTQQLDRVYVDTANLARVREEADQQRQRAEQLKHQELQLLAELDSERRKLQSATQRAEHMERKLLQESETLAKQREENRRLQDEADKAKKKSQSLEKEYEEQNMKMEEYLDKIMGENGRKEKEVTRIQQEISQLKQTHVEICSEHRKTVDTINKEASDLRDEKCTLGLRYRSLEAQVDEYRRKCKEYEQRCKQCEERMPELDRHYYSSQEEIKSLRTTMEEQERRWAKAVEQKEAELQAKHCELQSKDAEMQSYWDRDRKKREQEAQHAVSQEAERAKIQELLQEFTRAMECSGGADSLRDALVRLSVSQNGRVDSSLGASVFALGRAVEALLAQFKQRETSLLSRTQELDYERQAVETRAIQRAKQDDARWREAALQQRQREDAEKSQSHCELEVNKENMRLNEVIHHQAEMIHQLEGQLKIESAAKVLTPGDAERILKHQQDHILSENQSLHVEMAYLKQQIGLSNYNR